eukprot:TRINITY_DN13663_c0_g2_i2.p1 TRINITY_DN13663_c0_g2~~TRINITY_DN13663_c0_g2_i2.p1  ORF type:complete len:398 (-),score=127.69 TRINITY_DN13663_c0_g2_i2:277-1470(-)
MPGGTDLLIGMERNLRDKEIQCAHLMAVVYEEQNRTQDKQEQVLRLDTERLELGRKLAEMESIKRLHIAELEARNRAMGSELDTSRMELDNKIREKRELMQAHAAYIEEMERQHANRVDELDTLVQQYRAKIWEYEAMVEGLQKQLDTVNDAAAAAATAHHPPVDLEEFAPSSEETLDSVMGKNEALLEQLKTALSELGQAEATRDAARQETEQLSAQFASMQETIQALQADNSELRRQTGAKPAAKPAAQPAARPAAAPTRTSEGSSARAPARTDASSTSVVQSSADNTETAAPAPDASEPGAAPAPAPAPVPAATRVRVSDTSEAGQDAEVKELASNIESLVSAQSDTVSERAHFDDLRRKLLHTCVSLLEEFDDNRCKRAHDLIEEVECELPEN